MPFRSGLPNPTRQLKGQAAEELARLFLEQQGFALVVANYRSRRGEVDLIMRKNRLLVFAEVRLRTRQDFGGAAASVTRAKQQKIIASAQAFLHHHPEFAHFDCRFDVLAVHDSGDDLNIEWLPAAFTT